MRLGLLAMAAVLWVAGAWVSASNPKQHTPAPKSPPTVDNLGDLQTAAREACEVQGLTLRAMLIAYDEKAQPVAARAACGEPRQSKS